MIPLDACGRACHAVIGRPCCRSLLPLQLRYPRRRRGPWQHLSPRVASPFAFMSATGDASQSRLLQLWCGGRPPSQSFAITSSATSLTTCTRQQTQRQLRRIDLPSNSPTAQYCGPYGIPLGEWSSSTDAMRGVMAVDW